MSKVWTEIVIRWDDTFQRYMTVKKESSYYEYDGDVFACKGDEIAKQTELMQQQNMAQQMLDNQQLMGLFQKQFASQDAINKYLQGKMQPLIENPTGFSPTALAAMRTSSTDTIAQQYQNAQRTLQSNQFANGSRDLPSGVNQQLNAALLQSEASDQASNQNAITLQDEQLKQANYWNAINELNGVGAAFNPLGYAGAATGAANSAVGAGDSVANLSQAVTASQQSGLMGAIGGIASGLLGSGGISSLFPKGKKQ